MRRDEIITGVKNATEPLSYAYALWLEGADATGYVDEFSDIDFWLDFEDDFEAQIIKDVEDALGKLAVIDFKYVINHSHPKIRQRIYHLNDTSEFLMIDFCWQLHSREDGVFIQGDKIEAAKVLFDKANVVRYKDYNPTEYKDAKAMRFAECKYRFSQHPRIIKYVRRKLYAEAFIYYNRYVIEPLVDALRLIFTPAHVDYYLVHISRHIPADKLKQLEYFLVVPTLVDIERKTKEAKIWFAELAAYLAL